MNTRRTESLSERHARRESSADSVGEPFPAHSRSLSSRFSNESLKASTRPRQGLNSISSSFNMTTDGRKSPRERTPSLSSLKDQGNMRIEPLRLSRHSETRQPGRPFRPDQPHRPLAQSHDDDRIESLADEHERPASQPDFVRKNQHSRQSSTFSAVSAPAASYEYTNPKSPLKRLPPRTSSKSPGPKQSLVQRRLAAASAVRIQQLSSTFSVTTASDVGSPRLAQFSPVVQVDPFKAQLVRDVCLWPEDCSDDDKLITINVSGQRHTISLATLNKHASRLSEYVDNAIIQAKRLHESRDRSLFARLPKESWTSDGTTPIAVHEGWPAQLTDDEDGPTVFDTRFLVDSPLKTLSALQTQLVPRQASIKSARAQVFSMDGIPRNVDEDDWTADFPFEDEQPGQRLFAAFGSDDEEASSIPSLSSSPTAGSPSLSSAQIKAMIPQLNLPQSLQRGCSSIYSNVGSRQSIAADERLEVFVERNPKPYSSIFNYLRTSALPAHLQSSPIPTSVDWASIPQALLEMVIQPRLADLTLLRDEAAWLELAHLQDLCHTALANLSTMSTGRPRPRMGSSTMAFKPASILPTPVHDRTDWI